MKKLLLILAIGLFQFSSGYAAIIWYAASYIVPSPTTGSAPGPGDAAEDFSLIAGTCTLSSNASIQSITSSGGNSLIISGSSTITVGADVNIGSGCSLTVQSGSTLIITTSIANGGTITVQKGANLIQVNNVSNSGAGSYSINATGNGSASRYNLWSSPVSSSVISSTFSGSEICDIYYFNASAQAWTRDVASSTCVPTAPTSGDGVMNSGRGYVVAGGGSVSFSGSINNGNVNSTVSTGSNPGSGWAGDSWNLIGNPYPSAISCTDFLGANSGNIQGTVYLWDDDGTAGGGYDGGTDFATWNLAGGSGSPGGGGGTGTVPNGFIATGQGFFVQAIAGGSVSFTNVMRGGDNSQFFKREKEDIVRVRMNAISPNNYSNPILIAFSDSATDGMDWGYDSKKLSFNSNFNFGSSMEGAQEPYVIQSFAKAALLDEKEVPLSVYSSESGVVVMELLATENLDSNVVIYLKDSKTGKLQDLSSGPFSVYLNSSETYKTRFSVIFVNKSGPNPTGIETVDELYMNVYSYNNTLYVNGKSNSLNSVDKEFHFRE